ncbi:MAG: hypothetical protein Q8R47_00075 [Nanoarchaeota archaeon]|nr:hypothetical protein [Nanoarchaeota archaeon]
MDQEFKDVVMECNNCHLEFYASTLQTDSQTNLLMCVNCLSLPGSRINILKDRPLKKNRVEIKEPSISPKKEQSAPMEAASESHYRCTSCRYEFRRKVGFTGNCPYCTKKSVATVKTH